MLKDTVGIPGVNPEIAPGLQQRRENLGALTLEVDLGMAEIHVAVHGHVRDTLEDPAQTVVKKLGIEEHTDGRIHGLGHALVIEEEDAHVPGSDIAEWCGRGSYAGVGNRLTVFTSKQSHKTELHGMHPWRYLLATYWVVHWSEG